MKNCAVICNKESGKGITDKELEKIKKVLIEKKYNPTLYLTKRPNDATKIIQGLTETDLVISIGGDGTCNEVIAGNLKRKKPIITSHIPTGTTNDIGIMLGMKKNIVNNLKDILNGEVKQFDICMINDTPFVYVTGFGKFINVPYETPRKLKKHFGYFAYIINAIKEFFNKTKMYEIEYTVNSETYKGLYSLILISNANHIAGINNIYQDIKLDDGQFEVLFCNIRKKKDLIKSLYIFLNSKSVINVPGLYFHRTNKLTLKFKETPKKNWTIDGEEFKSNDNTYTITVNKKIHMLLPKKNLKKLFIK